MIGEGRIAWLIRERWLKVELPVADVRALVEAARFGSTTREREAALVVERHLDAAEAERISDMVWAGRDPVTAMPLKGRRR